MKLIVVFIVIFIGSCFTSNAQTYTFKTSGYSTLQKKTTQKWGNWSEIKETALIVKLDTNKNRIIVYSENIQLFEILEYIPRQENQTDIVYDFVCQDNTGEPANLSIITRKNQDNRKQLYIQYQDRIIVYNIFNYK